MGAKLPVKKPGLDGQGNRRSRVGVGQDALDSRPGTILISVDLVTQNNRTRCDIQGKRSNAWRSIQTKKRKCSEGSNDRGGHTFEDSEKGRQARTSETTTESCNNNRGIKKLLTHAPTHARIHVNTHTHAHATANARAHAYAHAHTNAHARAHIHAQDCESVFVGARALDTCLSSIEKLPGVRWS